MNTLNTDSINTLNQDELALNLLLIDNLQECHPSEVSPMGQDMIKAMNEMTQDPVLRKKIGMMLV